MGLTHRWTGRNEAEVLGWLRLHCYGGHSADYPRYLASVTDDDRARDGQFLIVERDGRPVGTATSVDLTLHLRAAALPCHGVAYVGTIRTERRKGRRGGERGVASEVMWRTIERGRERGDAVSALMPFRASFYEHFGYGVVEQHARWSLPMAVLAGVDTPNDFRPFQLDHLPQLQRLRQRVVRRGACDLERTPGVWNNLLKSVEGAGGGFLFVDQTPTADGELPVRAWVQLVTDQDAGVPVVRVADYGVDDAAAFRGLLSLLGSLRDQYARAVVTTPVDWPVARLLAESQIPHRPVSHATASLTCYTRMMLRILDHRRVLESMVWPGGTRGSVVVAVLESEGHDSRFRVEVSHGRATVSATTAASADVAMPDRVWAAVVAGDLKLRDALTWGLAEGDDRDDVLGALFGGPRPFTWEYF